MSNIELGNKFATAFAHKGLHGRFATFRKAVELLGDQQEIFIVETGSIRDRDDFRGGGQSTQIWDWLVQQVGGHVPSIDIDPAATILWQM